MKNIDKSLAPIRGIDNSLTGGKRSRLNSQELPSEEWEKLSKIDKNKLLLRDFQKINRLFYENSHPGYLYDVIQNGSFSLSGSAGEEIEVKGGYFLQRINENSDLQHTTIGKWYSPGKDRAKTELNKWFKEMQETYAPEYIHYFVGRIKELIASYVNIETIQLKSIFYEKLDNDGKKAVVLAKVRNVFSEELNVTEEQIQEKIEDLDQVLIKYGKQFGIFMKGLKGSKSDSTLLEEYFSLFIEDKTYLSQNREIFALMTPEQRELLGVFLPVSEIIGINNYEKTLPEPEGERDVSLSGFSLITSNLEPSQLVTFGYPRMKGIYETHIPQLIDSLKETFGIADEGGGVECRIRYQRNNHLKLVSYNYGLVGSLPEKNESGDNISIQVSGKINDYCKEITQDEIREVAVFFANELNSEVNAFLEEIQYSGGYFPPNENSNFQGAFTEEGMGGSNIIFMDSDESTGSKDAYVNLSSFSVDKILFFMLQLIYYKKHKKFIPKEKLYTEIYRLYAKQMSNGKEHNIENTPEYEAFMETFVFPHSSTPIRDTSHTILVGPPGSGKSQTSGRLARQSTFHYEGAEFNIDCIVVCISGENISDFRDSESELRQRIMAVQENTKKHIIILVEDIDVAIFSNMNNAEVEKNEQTLTNILEGIGSLENVTLITNTNNPYRFPERLVRGGRFDNIIIYRSIKEKEVAKEKLEEHIQLYKLQEVFNDELINYFSEKFIGLTYSSIEDFCKKIRRKIGFLSKIDNEVSISQTQLEEIFNSINSSKKILRAHEENTNEWLRIIRDKLAEKSPESQIL